MGFVELLLLAIGLSMDAFAVSVCKGLCMKRLNLRQATVIALFFGGFQALMPLVGWALGTQFEQFITPVDHWIAFVLLALIGGKMLWDAFHEDDDELSCPADGRLDLRELVMLAIATSIDALAVGITFAFLRVDILTSVGLIGVTTFALSIVGVAVGHRFGARYEKPATVGGPFAICRANSSTNAAVIAQPSATTVNKRRSSSEGLRVAIRNKIKNRKPDVIVEISRAMP